VSRKSVALLVLLFAAPVVVYLLWPSDESRIRKLFREGAVAVEKRNLEEVMAKVSFNYRDEEHGLSYLALKEILKEVFGKLSNIQMDYEIRKIGIKEKNATAEVDLRVIATRGEDTGYIIGDASSPVHLTFSLEKERTKWHITGIRGFPDQYQ